MTTLRELANKISILVAQQDPSDYGPKATHAKRASRRREREPDTCPKCGDALVTEPYITNAMGVKMTRAKCLRGCFERRVEA